MRRFKTARKTMAWITGLITYVGIIKYAYVGNSNKILGTQYIADS